ncbi:hypothetical protein WS83_05285 [Burkholderia sp. MSMB2042]|nr:hypothetical protein WS78_11435 [Burkholderia savannae]KVG47194.1 hypothetical protein WS77_28960 [Burkholderia sp. MSMB0265]KVG77966.1 hypothetical protein WS81_17530 [Burkholderia sp. MSMB2040]KVG95266.1 hypothetical protein WS83_05285 [Burkholderia sp. MSMB2042]KVG99429.1 hypothetical protein WS82_24790 [Burkholderia sp. MSMB2041]KVK85166.1 hypothetical protein WS91_03995 [Burkholderia sp. MSMB1498]
MSPGCSNARTIVASNQGGRARRPLESLAAGCARAAACARSAKQKTARTLLRHAVLRFRAIDRRRARRA